MQLIGVHTRGHDNFHNYGVWLTPNKRDWALSGGDASFATAQGYYPPQGGHPHPPQNGYYPQQQGHHGQQPAHAQPMEFLGLSAAAWSAIAGGTSAAMSAGVFATNATSGDLSWTVQKMDGWKAVNEHPVPVVPVHENTLHATEWFEMLGPIYEGTYSPI